MNWHRLSIETVFELMGSAPQGLSSLQAEEKLLDQGPNQLEEGKQKYINCILKNYPDLMELRNL